MVLLEYLLLVPQIHWMYLIWEVLQSLNSQAYIDGITYTSIYWYTDWIPNQAASSSCTNILIKVSRHIGKLPIAI